jgi:hypothetical protein
MLRRSQAEQLYSDSQDPLRRKLGRRDLDKRIRNSQYNNADISSKRMDES